MNNKGKITGILLFTVLLLGIVYLSVVNKRIDEKIKSIGLTGNNYLTKEQYLNFLKLNNIYDFKFLSLHIVKSRFEKHPYIDKVDVKFITRNEILVNIHEKKFEAVLLKDSSEFLITKEFELIPIISPIRNFDLPVIYNPESDRSMKSFSYFINCDTKTAFRILESTKLINSDLYNDLTEINLRRGHDIVLGFRGFDFPVVVGRGNETEKIFCFKQVWDKLKDKNINELDINYIDLRFDKIIYIGTNDTLNVVKGV